MIKYLLGALLILSLSACGGGGEETPTENPTENQNDDTTGGTTDDTTGDTTDDTTGGTTGDTTGGTTDDTTGGTTGDTTGGTTDDTTGGTTDDTTGGTTDDTTGGTTDDTTGGTTDDTTGGTTDNQLGSYVFAYPPSPTDDGEVISRSSVEGVVRSAASGGAISGVTVTLNATTNAVTASDGSYKFENVAASTYSISFEKTGFIGTTYGLVVSDVAVYGLDALLFIPSTYTGVTALSGQVLDAKTGSSLTGVTVNVRSGLNNKTGTVTKTSTSTTAEYSLSVDKGYYTLEVSKAGYINEFYNIYASNDAQVKDLVISEVLSTDEIRVVLTWGETPRDLDSHLARYEGSTFKYHVYYSSMNGSLATDDAKLDTDDTSSYGPETMTFNEVNSATYKYYVHNYSDKSDTVSSTLASSGAKVTVYRGNESKSYYPPSSAGTVWKVFEINNGFLTACTSNCMTYESSSSNTTTFGRLAPARVSTQEINIFSDLPRK